MKMHKDPKKVKCAYIDCMTYIPNKYGKPGVSLSRHDNKTLICSYCGKREAFNMVSQSMLKQGITL